MKIARFFLTTSGQMLFVIITLVSIGLLNLYSATYYLGPKAILFKKQLFWTGLGFITLWVFSTIDHRKLRIYTYHIYTITVLLLFALLFLAPPLLGTKRWFALGPISIQPSELAKIVFIITIAQYLSETKLESQTLKVFLKALILTVIPVFLVVLEPDLGTAVILLILFGSMCVLSKVSNKILLVMGSLTIAFLPFIWKFMLKDYQRARILGFLFPHKDPLGVGYHVLQSKTTIGSGKLWGKGFLKGTQSQLHFLPEHYTDFVFSVFAEQWGFIGCVILLTLYLLLILMGIRICKRANHPFTFLLAGGITALFFWQVFINIAMTLGLLPVVGVPLPFMSYGGSAMLVNFIAVGILINIDIKNWRK